MRKTTKRFIVFFALLALMLTVISGCSGSSSNENGFVTVTVKRGDVEKSVTTDGGTVAEAISQAGFNAEQFDADTDVNAQLQDGMVINITPKSSDGFLTEDGKTSYYVNGEKQTNAIVGSDEGGYFYANAEGVIDYGYCDAINVDGTDWNIINGKATVAQTESELTLNRALQAVAKCTDSSMTKEEKLKASFEYIKSNYLEGVLHDPPYFELDWPVIYANDLFVYGKGDCWSYGAAFAYFGKAIGCEECYACNSGGHGWAEIDGLVYDPEWDKHHPEYPHFAVDYDNNDTDVNYKKGISPGEPYMRVAV